MMHSFPVATLDRTIAGKRNVVFLDTARPGRGQRYSLLFKNPLRIYRSRRGTQIGLLLKRISEESKKFWIAGYLAYEAAYWLEEKFSAQRRLSNASGSDLAWFGVFDEPFIFDHGTGRWNRPITMPGKSLQPSFKKFPVTEIFQRIKKTEYFRVIRKIKKLIAAGDVYQVNFTYDVTASSPLEPWELYKELREMQPVPFGAFIKTDDTAIASFSPELFFMRQRNRILVKPMKGTAPRGRCTGEDMSLAQRLAADPKNRSENIMIVDLLRNDLGKICKNGSVKTQRLFDVERHPTIHQMTSSIEGHLREGVVFSDIITAIFPSGSVTGAPKLRAMEIIGDLEQGNRGVYCGAIGYLSPQGKGTFSVPIRTLQKVVGEKLWRYRVGSGIVWDSSAEEEWQECRDKCNFLTRTWPDFKLFESLLFSQGRFFYLREHRARLFSSARYFDFALTGRTWDQTVQSISGKLSLLKIPFKVRIFCDRNGTIAWDCEPIIDEWKKERATAIVSKTPVNPDNPFLFHKTTVRGWYAKASSLVKERRVFDVMYMNTRGELTEGSRSNLFIKINGALYTPPVECGLLPGVLRGRLIKSGKCKEKILFKKDLEKADALYCGNSVRGLVRVTIV
jgi:para-aminobenzoate synthetase/4-amino-4-deoxychorismate lyase